MTESFTEQTFDSLALKPAILRAVAELGFEKMTPVQAEAIPLMLDGRDVIAQAQTGTGKTAAFGLPVLEKCDPDNREVQVLILCPTRELAVQVAGDIRSYAAFLQGVKTLPVYGGQDISRQITALKGTQIVVGTPGRIMDHMRRHTLKLDHVHTVILDEADEMLDMGFREDMETILGTIAQEHQTAMFSATMPQAILDLTDAFLKEPVTVRITKEELTIPSIDQYYYSVKREFKVQALLRLIAFYNYKKCMIFCNMKSTVDTLVSELQKEGCMAEALHGDLSQFLRDAAMKRFRENNSCVLVATDIAARGIDVGNVEAVFNYDIPQEAEYYVHRIGRTGRAGKAGVSHTLVGSREFFKVRFIESICHAEMTERDVPTAEEIREAQLLKALDLAYEMSRGRTAGNSAAAGVSGSGKAARKSGEGSAVRGEDTVNELLLAVHEYCNTHHIAPEELAAGFLRLKIGEKREELDIGLSGKRHGGTRTRKDPNAEGRRDEMSGSAQRPAKGEAGFDAFQQKHRDKHEFDPVSERREQKEFLRRQKEKHFRWGTWDVIEEDYKEEKHAVRRRTEFGEVHRKNEHGKTSAGRSRAAVPPQGAKDKSYQQKTDRKENRSRSKTILSKAVKDVNARGWAAPAKKRRKG